MMLKEGDEVLLPNYGGQKLIIINLEFLSSVIGKKHFVALFQHHWHSAAILFEYTRSDRSDNALWHFVLLRRFREIETTRALLGCLESFDQDTVHQRLDAAGQQRHDAMRVRDRNN